MSYYKKMNFNFKQGLNAFLGKNLCGEADILECLVLTPTGHDVGEGAE